MQKFDVKKQTKTSFNTTEKAHIQTYEVVLSYYLYNKFNAQIMKIDISLILSYLIYIYIYRGQINDTMFFTQIVIKYNFISQLMKYLTHNLIWLNPISPHPN